MVVTEDGIPRHHDSKHHLLHMCEIETTSVGHAGRWDMGTEPRCGGSGVASSCAARRGVKGTWGLMTGPTRWLLSLAVRDCRLVEPTALCAKSFYNVRGKVSAGWHHDCRTATEMAIVADSGCLSRAGATTRWVTRPQMPTDGLPAELVKANWAVEWLTSRWVCLQWCRTYMDQRASVLQFKRRCRTASGQIRTRTLKSKRSATVDVR